MTPQHEQRAPRQSAVVHNPSILNRQHEPSTTFSQEKDLAYHQANLGSTSYGTEQSFENNLTNASRTTLTGPTSQSQAQQQHVPNRLSLGTRSKPGSRLSRQSRQ